MEKEEIYKGSLKEKIVVFQNPREREDETKNKRESEISS